LSKARPRGVRFTARCRIDPEPSTRTKPFVTASSQTGILGQVVVQASITSP
jgi:hypothetical protein